MGTRTIRKPRFMPIYVAEDTTATNHLSAAQYGAYIRLCRYYWHNGPPPDDDTTLARLAGMAPREWSTARPVVAPFFEVGGGQWINPALDAELHATYLVTKKNNARTAAATEARRLKREAERMRNAVRHVERYVERDANVTLSQDNKTTPAPAKAADMPASCTLAPPQVEGDYLPDDLEPIY